MRWCFIFHLLHRHFLPALYVHGIELSDLGADAGGGK